MLARSISGAGHGLTFSLSGWHVTYNALSKKAARPRQHGWLFHIWTLGSNSVAPSRIGHNQQPHLCRSRRQFSTSQIHTIRLLNVKTLDLTEFSSIEIPPYAILSHRWGNDEVSFLDMQETHSAAEQKGGFSKIKQFCDEAGKQGYHYAWVDSCCIDKRSSAELSEAINSMYKWYQDAAVCYAYLSDVPASGICDALQDPFSKSLWFTRGWTLQELIAPKSIKFFAQDWSFLGTRHSLIDHLETVTGIKRILLSDERVMFPRALEHISVAEKMSWASRRTTTREEDMAYCLMGLFNVNMPVLYGEGLLKAFKRLQLEIIKMSPDQSIFAWRAQRDNSSLFAESPADFVDSIGLVQGASGAQWWATRAPYEMTNFGLSITLPLTVPYGEESKRIFLATLSARRERRDPNAKYPIMIYLKSEVQTFYRSKTTNFYRRVRCNELVLGPKESFGHISNITVNFEDMFIPEDEIYYNFRSFPEQHLMKIGNV